MDHSTRLIFFGGNFPLFLGSQEITFAASNLVSVLLGHTALPTFLLPIPSDAWLSHGTSRTQSLSQDSSHDLRQKATRGGRCTFHFRCHFTGKQKIFAGNLKVVLVIGQNKYMTRLCPVNNCPKLVLLSRNEAVTF